MTESSSTHCSMYAGAIIDDVFVMMLIFGLVFVLVSVLILVFVLVLVSILVLILVFGISRCHGIGIVIGAAFGIARSPCRRCL